MSEKWQGVSEVVGCTGRVWLRGRCTMVWGGSRKRSLVVNFICVDGRPHGPNLQTEKKTNQNENFSKKEKILKFSK